MTQAPARRGEITEIVDLAALKALAQPRRQLILQQLTLYGRATSAILARALGLNTGATSYHLRELARYGFVEETEGASPRRERWWRAVPGDRRFPPRSRQSSETRLVMDELNHQAYAADLDLFERLQREAAPRVRPDDGDRDSLRDRDGYGDDGYGDGYGEWVDAFPYSRGSITLALPELREFFEEYIALLNRYKRPEADTPPGARTVLTRFFALPLDTLNALHSPHEDQP
ncbi:helix-turn-helix domain-containing protein [Streptomyces sp. NPDC051907]|uniref:ArsR/SmtB family transcription factor n=1 Tax=Streptomyces sp. NPDC051907 TaxID=3155284 RepID=UPI00343B08AD